MKKKIGFFVCSNGLGHFSRVLKISKYLTSNFEIDIFCEKFQYDKFKPTLKANFNFYKISNIRWDETLDSNKVNFEQYLKWSSLYGPVSLKYDIVVSDNLAGLLRYRNDILLSGSFLWKDVFFNKFKNNKITDFDNDIISKTNPLILTNKYAETGTLKEYKNKKGFGWGCDIKKLTIWDKSKKLVLVEPSLKYLETYNIFLNKIKNLPLGFKIESSAFKTANCCFIIRPGVGMLTHCIENHIPIIALYDTNDSNEIIELAKKVDTLGIGFSHNVNKSFDIKRLINNTSNDIYNKVSFEKEGYKNIAQYIKEL
tara:strand:+ start:2250 stop:3185 length:936 start_codon:yes stop_codon:yes gene_type:complete